MTPPPSMRDVLVFLQLLERSRGPKKLFKVDYADLDFEVKYDDEALLIPVSIVYK